MWTRKSESLVETTNRCFLSRLPAFLFPVLLGLAWVTGSCNRDPFLNTSPLYPSSAAHCASCHPRCYDEWKRSAHSDAWLDEDYRSLVEGLEVRACLGCHVPGRVPPYAQGRPGPREILFEEGVNCTACHYGHCPKTVTAPDTPGAPPPSSAGGVSTDGLCGACHRETYEEWQALGNAPGKGGASGEGCVSCHMPLGEDTKRAEGLHRTHALPPPAEGCVRFELLSVTGRREGPRRVEIAVLLRGTGHSLPTGRHGRGHVRLRAWIDGRSEGLLLDRRLFAERGEALRPGRNGPYAFRLPPGGKVLRLEAVLSAGPAEKRESLLGRLEVPLSGVKAVHSTGRSRP